MRITSLSVSPLAAIAVLAAAQLGPSSASAENCPKGGCQKAAAPAPRAAQPAAQPRVFAPGPRAAPSSPPGQPVRPPFNGAPNAAPNAYNPSAPGQRPVARPGAFGSTVYPPGSRAPGGQNHSGAFSSNRTFTFHGRTFAAVRAQPYRYVRGYSYRPFYRGQRFPAFLLLAPYFITNYYLYNLSPPPGPGLVWVRFGPDALLVNTYTGEVVDTAPGLFDEGDYYGDAGYPPPGPGYGPPPGGPDYGPPPPGYDGQPPANYGPPPDNSTAYPGPTGYPEPPPPTGPQD